MKPHEREKQAVSLVAAFVVMGVMAFGPIMLVVHRGPWSPVQIASGAGVGLAGAFALSVLLRNQRLRPDESTFSGRFGLVVAILGVLVLCGGLGFCIWALLEPQLAVMRPGRALAGCAGCVLGVGYLARSILRNLRGEEVTRDERSAR